jgi:hypothetical protein
MDIRTRHRGAGRVQGIGAYHGIDPLFDDPGAVMFVPS